MLCLSGFELHSRWVPLKDTSTKSLISNLTPDSFAPPGADNISTGLLWNFNLHSLLAVFCKMLSSLPLMKQNVNLYNAIRLCWRNRKKNGLSKITKCGYALYLILLWSSDSHKALCPRFRSYKLGLCIVCQKRNKEST